MGVYQIGELIKRLREGRGLTQEELSEVICAPETLSRIECGKRAPSRANFAALMGRLGRSGEVYLPYLHSSDMEVYTQNIQILKYISSHRYKEAEKFLAEMEKKINIKDSVNMQFITWTHAIIDMQLERICISEALSKLQEAIRYTIPSYQSGYLPHMIFTHHEITILCDIAILMKMNGEEKDAISLLEQIANYFDTTRVDMEERASTEALVLLSLGKMLAQEGERKRALEMEIRIKAMCLSSGKAGFLSSVLYNIGYEKEILTEDREECVETMREAYYVAELMKNERQRLHIKKHVMDKYGDIF